MYRERLNKIANKMKQRQIDQLLVTAEDSIYYLTGQHIHPGERLLVAAIDQHANLTLYTHQMFACTLEHGEVVYYRDEDAPVEKLASALVGATLIGVDKTMRAQFLLRLMDLVSAKYIIGSAAVDDVRLLKDTDELKRMRQASLLNDQAMAKVYQLIAKGNDSELEMQRKIEEIFIELGAEKNSFTPIICYGAAASEPHHLCDNQRLQGGAVIVDMGCVYRDYCSDMTRSFYRGEPTDDYKRAYQAVLDANLAAIDKVAPGVPLSDIDLAARSVIEQAGFGEYFIHRTGHGIGIDVHEFPDVSATSEAVCQVGMVFSIEPGIYIPGQFGIRIEDLVTVTADGCEVLNHYDKSLSQI